MNECGNYWARRYQLIKEERGMALGSNIILTKEETIVNKIIMKHKQKELDDSFEDPLNFPPAKHFFEARKEIDKSTVYAILKEMPKGTALHIHDISVLPPEWVIKNATYRDHLYALVEENTWRFQFTEEPPTEEWRLVKELRNEAESVEEFDQKLKSLLSLEVKDPAVVYKDINSVWKAFTAIFKTISPLITYLPVYENYIYAMLQAFYDDNVMYIEVRGILYDLYELNGSVIDGMETIALMETVTENFIQDHPNHMGMKFIYSPPRSVDNDTMKKYLSDFRVLKKRHPDFIAGFDLVGQEDTGTPLCDFIDDLKGFKDSFKDTRYFFHAGETDWNGMKTDNNLIDAILLGTSRIGHGFALVKHPKLMEEVKSQDIAIELNPISNQVLMLVNDLRNHPGSVLFSQDFPVVVSSDDPGFWGASVLSHDFYVAFMAMASYDDDLRFLKQLALNSIKYSTFSEQDRTKAMSLFEYKWKSFLKFIITVYS